MSASSPALKNLISRALLSRSLRPLRAVTPPAVPIRFFSTTAAPGYDSDDNVAEDGRPITFPFIDNATKQSSRSKGNLKAGYQRELWKTKDKFDGMYMRVDMPGVSKENIKIRVENGYVVIEGEGHKDFEYDEFGHVYKIMIQLFEDAQFNIDGLKANIANGVLKVFVPKIMESTNYLHLAVL